MQDKIVRFKMKVGLKVQIQSLRFAVFFLPFLEYLLVSSLLTIILLLDGLELPEISKYLKIRKNLIRLLCYVVLICYLFYHLQYIVYKFVLNSY